MRKNPKWKPKNVFMRTLPHQKWHKVLPLRSLCETASVWRMLVTHCLTYGWFFHGKLSWSSKSVCYCMLYGFYVLHLVYSLYCKDGMVWRERFSKKWFRCSCLRQSNLLFDRQWLPSMNLPAPHVASRAAKVSRLTTLVGKYQSATQFWYDKDVHSSDVFVFRSVISLPCTASNSHWCAPAYTAQLWRETHCYGDYYRNYYFQKLKKILHYLD